MTAASSTIATAAHAAGAGSPRTRRRAAGWLGYTPFAVYVLLFLAIPTVYAVGSGFFGKHGFTLQNFAAFGNPVILKAFGNSVALSAATAVVSAIIGAVVCVALLAVKPGGFLRVIVDSASSVLTVHLLEVLEVTQQRNGLQRLAKTLRCLCVRVGG